MRILVAEDSAVYLRIIGSHLAEWGFEMVAANDGREAWRLLRGMDAPKLALLDWVLPGMDGIEICRNIRSQHPNQSYVYTVLLTGKNTRQDFLEAVSAGADDFLAKPFDEMELKARLMAGKRILDLHDELVEAREELRFAATHDELTGIYNRAEILSFMRRELNRAQREGKPVGIALIDIDHFKRVNDSLGHVVGDSVLQAVAKNLSSGLRSYDGAGRYGGEEFLLVLPGCDLAAMLARAEGLRKSVAGLMIPTPLGPAKVTVSIGIMQAGFGSELQPKEILQSVDEALYQAKQTGRNRVECVRRSTTSLSSPPAYVGRAHRKRGELLGESLEAART